MTKKSFILYTDIQATVQKLPDDKAGLLFKMILDHVNGQEPATDDLLLQIAFEPIKQQLNRNLENWDHMVKKRSEAGRKGGRPKSESGSEKANGFAEKQTKAKKANAFQEKQTEAKKADNDNDNVNVNGTVTEIQNTNTEAAPLLQTQNFEKNNAANSLHAHCIGLYTAFFEKFSGGAPPKIDGAQGKAMKCIIAYLKGAVRKKQPGIAGDALDEAVKDALQLIFTHWHKLDKFYQHKTRLTELNSNLQNIIIQIRHSGETAGFTGALHSNGRTNRPSKMEIISRMAQQAKQSTGGP